MSCGQFVIAELLHYQQTTPMQFHQYNLHQKASIPGLLCSTACVMIHLAVLSYDVQTDTHTDGHRAIVQCSCTIAIHKNLTSVAVKPYD